MGFMLYGLEAEAYDRTYSDRQLFARVIGYFRTQRAVMLIVAAVILLNSLADIAYPLLLAQSLDSLASVSSFQKILLLVGILLAAGVLSWVCNFLRQLYTARAVGRVVYTLQQDALAAVIAQDMSFYDQFSSGKIVSRVTSDTENFAAVVTLTLNLISLLVLFFIVAGVLCAINPLLAGLALTIAPLIVVLSLGFRRAARLFTRRSRRSQARVNASVQEALRGITVMKNFRQEQSMYHEFKQINDQAYYVNIRAGFLSSGILPLLFLITTIGTTIVVYFGGLDVLSHRISAGQWFLFVQSLGILWVPLTNIASFWSQFQWGLSASERVFALIDAGQELHQTGHEQPPRLAGRIEFRDVSFQYARRQVVLADFNLTIQAGETVALVGHTGAGKTSLGRLIARFYEFQGGQILIDGHDIRSFDLQAYHRQLGIVPQVPFLFSGTVADNIRYARPEADNAEVERVAQSIGGGDWLESLPHGLHTEVGEEGRILSPGQRQLVALARVILQDPPIIILDEATASIDPLTERQIQEGFEHLLTGRTALVIAHRLSTIRHADRIIVLDHGRIIEEGAHTALIERGGYYALLYNTYFRHQAAGYQPGTGFVPVQPTKISPESSKT